MPESNYGQSVNGSDMLNRIIRAVVLIVVALLLAIVSVSFAVHHMRLQYEEEYNDIIDNNMNEICNMVSMTVKGDEIVADPTTSASKYQTVFDLMLMNTSSNSLSDKSYGLFLYSNGQLSLLCCTNGVDADSFAVTKRDISEWLSSDNSAYTVEGDDGESVLVPIPDSQGKCVAVFEYKYTNDKLNDLGDKLESRVLTAVIVSVAAGIVLFGVQMLVPEILRKSSKGGQHL